MFNGFRHLTLITIALAMCAPAHARRVQREVVKIASGKQWRVNDSVCFHRADKIIACGKVIGNTHYLVAIRSPALTERVSPGETLYVFGAGPGRQPNSFGDKYVVKRTVPLFHRSLSFGGYGGEGYFIPAVHFQLSLGRGLALGLMPAFYRPSRDSSIFGSFGTLEFYLGGNAFSGLNLALGAGIYSFQDSAVPSKWVPVAQTTFGYRFLSRGGLNFGLGVGIQYVDSDSKFLRGTRTSIVQPLAKADVGFSF